MPISRDDRGSTVLSARGISKSFNDVPVLFGVDFDVRAGEIHALMGENGAGKSTLVKILSGFEAPTSGDLILDGQSITLPPDGKAEHVGIVLIHQEMNLADHLTVTESLFLGREMLRFGLLNRKEMRAQTRAVLRDLGADVHEDALISDLTIAQKQMVEIAKAISRRARVIFMDEPTAVLSQDEVAKLFAQVRKLRDQGTSFVFVSHKLDEVMALTDRVTVLRDGQWIKTEATRNLDSEKIAQLMVGRELSSLYPTKAEPDVDAPIALEVRNLSTGFVKNASFSLRRGEILGFSGLIGAGRSELMEAIVGLHPRASGTVMIDGVDLPAGNMAAATEMGLAYLTKDRKGKGLLLQEGLTQNLTLQSLAQHCRVGFLSPFSEAKAMQRAKRRFDIRVRDPRIAAGRMSGGNQQKLLLAKVLETDPKIIIIDEPTRGIDVGTKQQIYQFIAVLAREGYSIIVVSSEMPEVIGLCARVAVMREGALVEILEGSDVNESQIMRAAAGLRKATA